MFKELQPEEMTDNPFRLIGRGWMLISAGGQSDFNTMTASWGGLGVLWERKVCTIYVRPTRFTYEFLERTDRFTLSFFDEQYRKTLLFCGTHSGRDTDKMRETGLTPVAGDGCVWYEQARLVLVCQKLYSQDILPELFRDPAIEKLYPQKDYHRMYIGEIVLCRSKEA